MSAIVRGITACDAAPTAASAGSLVSSPANRASPDLPATNPAASVRPA